MTGTRAHERSLLIATLTAVLTAVFLSSYASCLADDETARKKKTPDQTCLSIINRKKDPPSKTCGGVLQTNEVAKHIGELATVEFLVDHTHECHKGLVYLNESKDYKTCFAAVIAREKRKAFPDDTSKEYSGKRVRVTGKIEIYGATPKIILDSPDRIVVLQK
jgi:hypothetical protein